MNMNTASVMVRMSGTSVTSFVPPSGMSISCVGSRKPLYPKGSPLIRQAVAEAIANPVGRTLAQVVDLKKRVLLIIDDHTRGTPTAETLEVLYDRLHDMGVSDAQMTILTSAGTHRAMTEDEIRAKTGELAGHIEVVQHDCLNPGCLYRAGEIDDIPVWLNRNLCDAGTVIGVGSLVAHKFSGWSGAAKIICPGVAGYETIYRCHYRSVVEENIVPGQKDNWFRRFINRVGDLAGLNFCVNFVPVMGGIAGVTAGDPRAVFERNVDVAIQAMGADFREKQDLVIVSAYPATTDMWQSGKGFYSGELIARDGGTIVLVSPLDEGLGDHRDFTSLLGCEPAKILDHLSSKNLPDPLAAVAAYAIRRIGERCRLRIVTSNSSLRGTPLLGAPISDNLQEVVNTAADGSGETRAAVLNDVYVLPMLR